MPWSVEDFRSIARLLRERRGVTLPPHRLGLLRARLHVRLRARGLPSFTCFHDSELRGRPDGPAMQLVLDLSTINHTAFFREPAQLRWLAERLAERPRDGPDGPARVWSAGCSAGQEPYSLAMAFAELVSNPSADRHLELWASDVSLEMVRVAARAIYGEREVSGVSPDRLRRFFLRGRGPKDGSYRVAPEIRRLAVFRHFDLRCADWPVPGDLDAILCRNVALYFDAPERLSLLDRLAGRLRRGGWLVVGNCEILPDRPGLLQKHAPSLFRRASTP